MIKSNCKGCVDRRVGCHSECSSYLTYAAECERVRQNRLSDATWEGYRRQCSDKATRIHYGKAKY